MPNPPHGYNRGHLYRIHVNAKKSPPKKKEGTRSILGIIVVSKDVHLRPFAHGDLADKRHQVVGCSLGIFSNETAMDGGAAVVEQKKWQGYAAEKQPQSDKERT